MIKLTDIYKSILLGERSNRIGEAYDDVSIDDIKRKNKYSQYNNFTDKKEVDGIGYLHFEKDAGDWYMWGEVKAFDLSDGTEVANVNYGKPTKFSQLKASVDVRPDFRRMGIATEIYDWVEELTGEQLYPDTPHSKSAQEFWKARKGLYEVNSDEYIGYHATSNKFNNFSLDKSTQKIIWFSSNLEKVKSGQVGASGHGWIAKVKLTIKNPAGWDEYDAKSLWELQLDGYDGAILPDVDEDTYFVFSPDQIKIIEWIEA